jgi:general secretion pathway protein D
LFASRNITTSIVIYDGQTVVLGGLIREDINKIEDKIPFLGDLPFVGRLFRSKVDSRSKRNLLIFVSARLIDPAGNPENRTVAGMN